MARQGDDVERASLVGLDGCRHPLTEALIWYAHHGGTPHARYLEQDPLDLGRVDVGPTAENQRVPPVSYEQSSYRIDVPDVSRVEDAVPDRLGRRLRMA